MIRDYLLQQRKSRSLAAQIRGAEREILIHQLGIGAHTTRLVRQIHQQITAPSTLLMACGIGFIIGELTKSQRPNDRSIADKQPTAVTSPLKIALNLMISAHTLYTALPIAWMIKSFQQRRASSSDCQVPEKQARPLPTGNQRNSS